MHIINVCGKTAVSLPLVSYYKYVNVCERGDGFCNVGHFVDLFTKDNELIIRFQTGDFENCETLKILDRFGKSRK